MTAQPKRQKAGVSSLTSAASGSVIPFTRPYSNAQDAQSQTLDLGNRLPPLNELGDRLRGALESVIAESYFQQLLASGTAPDNPFDEVYISRLTPDPIADSDVARLRRFAHVTDLSDSISLADGWDD